MEGAHCHDPHFDGVLWPALPRPFIARVLRAAARHGLTVTLDTHTYPGGTSTGTFSGVWPRVPAFWSQGDRPEAPEEDQGRQLFKQLLEWCASLKEDDPRAYKGLGAITPMNEPAHLAGTFNPATTFLPPLPAHMPPYAPEGVPAGNHLRALKWLEDAIGTFRTAGERRASPTHHPATPPTHHFTTPLPHYPTTAPPHHSHHGL